jgi:hypothetical protein
MNRQDILELQQVREYPAITVLMPTHRTSPDNQQDPIRLKNLVKETESRLLQEFSKREAAPYVEALESLADEVDFRHTLDGLALLVSNSEARKFYLPFALEERVVIDETFATRNLVFALNRTPRYWALVLSEQPTRLFEGVRDTLDEVVGRGFPLTLKGPGGASRLPGGHGVNASARRDASHRHFFQEVDEKFGAIAGADDLPLAVVGVDRYQAFFREVTRHGQSIVATVTGSHDRSSPHELAELVWPEVEKGLAAQRGAVLEDLDAAVGARRSASGIGEAWRFAQEGRARVVLVEEGFHYPATVDESGMVIEPAEDASAPGVIHDAVDEVIESVIAKGGRAMFFPDGALEQHQRIALILRY